MLTNTWRQRLDRGGALLRRGALITGLTSCTVVAVATIWGWIVDDPIDVAGPARTAVNRTALIGSYAQDCVTRWLTATDAQRQSLHDCWSLRDPIRLPTTAPVVASSPAVSAVTLITDTGTAQQWSVVVSVCERPYQAAPAHTAYYRLPVVYTNYGVRATALPARVNGPGGGADAPLAYPANLPVGARDQKTGANLPTGNPVSDTVAGFITSYLTGAGGLERYVTPTSGLLPAADYRSALITKLTANHNTPDHDVPAEATTVHVLASVEAITSGFAPLQLDYPITVTVTSGRWSVSGLDYAPLLADGAELTPVIPTTEPAPR